ncbi:hypothetical protein CBR_g44275 [Chara braunii]|uniref:Reverse transcriptase domain-containing protein n=1 Tax=Chara braunii TaxID=69332 RepID=A0A388K2V6_CHABU|nr:hypothetical protein CBR_g44275 [Chara braunii]|eukprot:GBG64391.1 hypothetical protein CBR_g44275 [Chara braunii]
MEKDEEVLRVIRERRATEGHRIPDEVADTMKIGIDGFLTEEETRLIKRTCKEFHLAFAFSDHQKGRLDAKLIPPLRIHTVEHECWNDKGSSYEFGIAGEVTDLLRAKMDSFTAEPMASRYANRWFVFRKPNKTLRWIQDLQKLNAVTIRDAGSLPQADLLAESHAGRSIYSLIDLYSGYDQLSLDVRDRPYTTMHTPVGQLQMQVTPMGFTNAVAEAQRRMLAVAGDMFPEKCDPYIDDNPIKGAQEKDATEVQPGIRKFVWDHLQDIKDLLRRFLIYNITASEPKSILAVPDVTIPGFRCGAYSRKPDPTKTDKISQWPTPLRTITEFDYKIERIAGIRNKADELSRVCITPEGVEGAEPIDAFLEYEGGTLVVDNEMMSEERRTIDPDFGEGDTCRISRTYRKTTHHSRMQRRKELMGSDSGTERGTNSNGGRGRPESSDELNGILGKDGGQEGEEFFYVQSYEGLFREIGLLLVGSKQPTEVSIKAREEAERPTGGEEAGPSQGRRAAKRKLYIGLMGEPVVGRGGRKCLCRKPSPLRKGEGIEISSDSEGGKEKAEVEEGGNADMGDKVQVSNEEGANRGKRRETWHGESEGGQDMRDEHEEGEERRENPLEGRSGHDSCEGYGTGTEIHFTYDPKNLAGGYSPIQTEDEEDEEEDVREVIEISSGDERDEISRPREEGRSPMHQLSDGAFGWENEFRPTPGHWFQQ